MPGRESPATLDATIQATLARFDRRADEAVGDTLATMRPGPSRRTHPELDKLLGGAAEAVVATRVELHGTLGEGGMSVVRLGTQHALGREVAVKTTRGDPSDAARSIHLLREAWLTGALEHPNVVPVYDIAVGDRGALLVVLKKIEGDDWESLIDDAAAVRERFGASDLLEWNLGILMQVCNAVRYAHSRRIVHRDIKPANVRVGTFGEVYLLDWGVAASLVDDGSGRLPTLADTRGVAGTPAYLAPEMLGDGTIDERTDVYLLGGVLHRIVTGRAPHAGAASWYQVVGSVLRSDPELPADVPDELAAILRKAMAKQPDDRFGGVEDLRQALAGFLEHRDAARLAQRAHERLAELLRRQGTTPADADHREQLYRLYSECRFGFQSALELWPGNERAREGQARAVVAMVEYELAHGSPMTARTLLGELEAAPAALVERVAAAERAQAAEEAELRQLKAQHDPDAGRSVRAAVSVVLALTFIAAPAVSMTAQLITGAPVSVEFALVVVLVICAVYLGLAYLARATIRRTRINLQLAGAVFFALFATVLAHLATILGGYDLWEPLHAAHLVWGGLAGATALAVDRRLLVSAAGYGVAYVVLAAVGREHVLVSIVITNLVLLANMAVLWVRPKEDLEAGRRWRGGG